MVLMYFHGKMQNEQDLLKMEVVFMEKETYLENNTKEGKNMFIVK